jgi:glutamate-1-semialdehyde 2,1-aminomutase
MPVISPSVETFKDRCLTVFPAGSNGEFNLPPELSTVIERGQGCELWDADGRHYYDFSLGWGSALVGHAHPEIVAAVVSRAPLGSNFACVNTESLTLAEEIVRLSPACDQVRFCASGTEANFYCLRLARAFTGRPKILKFEGAYHGANAAGVTSLFPELPPDYPHPQPTSAGTEGQTADEILVAPFNDLTTARQIIARHAGELAAVIVEPLQRCTPPVVGFLEGLRQITHENDVLLVFDEVVTGFRLAYGGAQEYYGVVPDLVAYGKALGGGYPIGAFGGRQEIMQLVREDRMGQADYVWTASTLGGNPVSCAAARAALGVFSRPGVYEKLHAQGVELRAGLARVLSDHGVTGQVIGDGPLAQVVFSGRPVCDYRSTQSGNKRLARSVMLGMFRRGIFLNPMGTKLYLSLAHDSQVCSILLEAFSESLVGALKNGEGAS